MYGDDYSIPSKYLSDLEGEKDSVLHLSKLKISTKLAEDTKDQIKLVLIHASVSCLGSYLNIPTLREIANDKLKKTIEAQWHHLEFCFPAIVQRIYDMDSEKSLHAILIDACALHIRSLYKRDDFRQLSLSPTFHLDVFNQSLEKRILK